MQSYYSLKLKCLMVRVMAGTALLLFSVSIAFSIIQEMQENYDSASRIAYITGLVICVLLLVLAAFLVYQGYHMESFVFRGANKAYLITEYEDQPERILSAGNVIMSDKALLVFSVMSLHMCKVIPLEQLLGCFESPSYEILTDNSDYSIRFYDHRLKEYAISPNKDERETAHALYEKICQRLPWILKDNFMDFEEKLGSRTGRKALMRAVQKKKYEAEKRPDEA